MTKGQLFVMASGHEIIGASVLLGSSDVNDRRRQLANAYVGMNMVDNLKNTKAGSLWKILPLTVGSISNAYLAVTGSIDYCCQPVTVPF